MRTLLDHREIPINFERPIIVSNEITTVFDNEKIKVFLSLDKNENVEGFYYSIPEESEWIPFFSLVAEQVRGAKLDQLPLLSWERAGEYWFKDEDFIDLLDDGQLPLVFLPGHLFYRLVEEYTGTTLYHSSLLGKEPADLLCRCFGIYKSDLKEIVKKEELYSVVDITAKTRAGGGCTSCLDDIDEIIAPFRMANTPADPFTGPAGFSPAQFILAADEVLKSWSESSGVRPDILKVEGNNLYLSLSDNSKVEITDNLADELQNEFDKKWPNEVNVYLATS